MRHVALRRTSLTPSRLGFGCSGLMARLDRAESLRLLQVAADSGITHFDVARSYGYGEAESVVGALLASRPGAFTVTTKVGILPPRRWRGLATAKAAARRLASLHPHLRQALRASASGMVRHGAFDLGSVQRSLEASLRALGVERVDLLLLHDCTRDDLRPDLLDLLLRCRRDGKVGQFGLATDRGTVRQALLDCDAFVPVAQFASEVWTLPDDRALTQAAAGTPGVITHSALGARFAELAEQLASDRAAARRWAERFGLDVADRNALGRLLLAASLSDNAEGVVLFSTARPATIRSNAELGCGVPLPVEEVAAVREMASEVLGAAPGGTAA